MRLGSNARIEVVSEVFILVSPPGYVGFSSAVALAKKAADAYFNNRIHTRPQHSIPIYVFGSASSYDAFCASVDGARCVSPLGFYDPTFHYVALNAGRGMGSLTHEMMHPLIEVDFPGVPDWFDEGVASLYGKAVFPSPGEVHGATNWRLPELRRALASPSAGQAGIDQLFGMSSYAFRDARQGLHYAMARYLCQWLDERDQLWPFYHRWRDNIAADPTGEKSFLAVTGETSQQANAAWIAWVKGLRVGS